MRENLKAADHMMPETEMFRMHMTDPRITSEMRRTSCGYVMCTAENVRKSYFKRGAASLRKKGEKGPWTQDELVDAGLEWIKERFPDSLPEQPPDQSGRGRLWSSLL